MSQDFNLPSIENLKPQTCQVEFTIPTWLVNRLVICSLGTGIGVDQLVIQALLEKLDPNEVLAFEAAQNNISQQAHAHDLNEDQARVFTQQPYILIAKQV